MVDESSSPSTGWKQIHSIMTGEAPAEPNNFSSDNYEQEYDLETEQAELGEYAESY